MTYLSLSLPHLATKMSDKSYTSAIKKVLKNLDLNEVTYLGHIGSYITGCRGNAYRGEHESLYL